MCSFQHQLQRQEGPVKKQIQVFNVFLQGKMKQIIEFDKKKKKFRQENKESNLPPLCIQKVQPVANHAQLCIDQLEW